MFIIGLGLAAPIQRFTQHECWEALRKSAPFARLAPRSRALLKKVLGNDNGIVTRHLALQPLSEAFDLTPDTVQARFARHAPELATRAARRALKDASCRAGDIDAILISTCTGYLCPGLTSYVSEALGLRPDVLALDLVGQGCGAALPALRTAEALLAARRARKVLSVCAEICSAAFYLDDDPGVLISACLFGDGAAAVVLADRPLPGRRRVEWKFGTSHLAPDQRDTLRFSHRNGMLRNILLPQVPALAARYVGAVLDEVLDRAAVGRSQVRGWVLHPGGRDVLAALCQQLSLAREDVRWSEAVLQEYGNVSSASVFFVLHAARNDSTPGGYWWMSSFGAGFSCHGALLDVE